MLITIAVARRGAGREPDEGGKVDIFVQPVDVGIGVMDDVVSNLPNITVSAKEVEAEAQQVVDGGIVGVGAMQGIMRYAESDARDADPQQDRQTEHGERGESIRHD